MLHPRHRHLMMAVITATLLLQGCAAQKDLSVIERPTGGMQIELPANSRIKNDDVCHALRYHVLDFDEFGQLDYPKTNFDCFNPETTAKDLADCVATTKATPEQATLDPRLACQIDAMRKAIKAGHGDGRPYDHIVLIVHGGLVSEDEGLGEAITATRAMTAEENSGGPSGNGHYYPIFVVWRSGAIPTYREQATSIEQGKRSTKFARIVAPVTVAGDVARGVAREPRFGASESLRLWNSILQHKFSLGDGEFLCRKVAEHMQDNAAPSIAGSTSYEIVCPAKNKSPDSVLKRSFKTSAYVLSTPVRVLTTPILLGPGQSAWENMQRRTRNLIWRDSNKRDVTLPDTVPPAVVPGGLQVLLERLIDPLVAPKPGSDRKFNLTLIGHSMGAIVVTEMLRLRPNLAFNNVVLMGAAVDMRGFLYALRTSQAVASHKAHVYNLTLHPDNEVFEQSGGGIMPSGSLLQWIDEAYQMPPTQLDRVLGKWTNLPALEQAIPPDIAHNVTFKMFGFDKGEPSRHGEFNDLEMCYWRPSFWQASDWPTHRDECNDFLSRLKSAAP